MPTLWPAVHAAGHSARDRNPLAEIGDIVGAFQSGAMPAPRVQLGFLSHPLLGGIHPEWPGHRDPSRGTYDDLFSDLS